MKSRILLLFCFLSFGFTFGQYDWTKGELLLRNGDTLSGYLKLPVINKAAVTNSHKIKYREKVKGKTKRFDYIQVNKLIFRNGTNEKISSFKYVKTSKSKYQLFKVAFNSDRIRLYTRMVSEISAEPNMITGIVSSFGDYPTGYNEYYVQRKFEAKASPLIKIGPLTKSFRNYAIAYFYDCSDLVEKIKNRTYNESDVFAIVEEYNACE